MTRTLIIPAAGIGSRLGAAVPKVLAIVAGRPMVNWLFDLYAPFVDRTIVVVSPSAEDTLREHLSTISHPWDVAVQTKPTGMLDAVMAPMDAVAETHPDRVWITWCDQVAVLASTLARMAQREQESPALPFVFPTHLGADPYIHFERDADGRIHRVLHRREGDSMPLSGESDIGVFSLSAAAYLESLPAYGLEAAPGAFTQERNFLPFIPWLARTVQVDSLPCTDAIEAVGVNTPDDLARVESMLRLR